jgi:hypothetical protein
VIPAYYHHSRRDAVKTKVKTYIAPFSRFHSIRRGGVESSSSHHTME